MAETTDNLAKYEELFAHRFTAEDREYQQYQSRPSDPPPIVEDWGSRGGGSYRGRNNRYQDRRGGPGWGGDRGGDRDGRWRENYHGQHQWQDRDRDRHQDRHRGHGSGYQSGPPSYNPGYNSNHQRYHNNHY